MSGTSSEKSNSNDFSEQQRRATYHWWIVLPIVVVSMTTATLEPTLFNDLLIRRYEYEYGIYNGSSPSSETACNTEDRSNDSNFVELSVKVQKSVSHLNIIMAGAGALPAALTYILLGSNCDRIGRRPLLIIPCLGRTLRYTILLLVVQYDLSDIWLIIANVIDGLFGSNSVLILGAIAYISDCTTNNERARAMILEEGAVALTRIFPLLGLGFWLQHHGYTLPMSIILGINFAALIYIFLLQPESCGENNRRIFYIFKQLKQIRLSPILGTYRVFFIKRHQHNQRTIILLTLTQISLFIVLFGFVRIQALYLYGKPLCFNVLDVAILTSAQNSLMVVIATILSFFQKIFLMNSMIIPVIGIGGYIIHFILFGLAHEAWMLYLSVFIGCLFFVVMAVIRSNLTKLVNSNEFALVFITTGIVETIGSYVLGIISNAIYAQTIEIYPGIIFFILAGIGLIPLILTGVLLLLSCIKPTEIVVVNRENSIDETMETKF